MSKYTISITKIKLQSQSKIFKFRKIPASGFNRHTTDYNKIFSFNLY